MDQGSIFPIPGINSNVNKNGNVYHVQTEVMTSKQLVVVHVFQGGNVLHAEFASFKKHYELLIGKEPEKLKEGIKKLVKILHQKGLHWLKDLKNIEEVSELTKSNKINVSEKVCKVKPILSNWMDSSIKNFEEDYPEITIHGFTYNWVEKDSQPINSKSEDFIRDTSLNIFLKTLSSVLIEDASRILDTFMKSMFLETERYKFFIYPYENRALGIFAVENYYPTGLLKMELERYYEAFKEIISQNIKLNYKSTISPRKRIDISHKMAS